MAPKSSIKGGVDPLAFLVGPVVARYGDLGRELRHRTLELLAGQDDIYEYYNPLSGMNAPRAAPIFGWSAAIFIDLAIQATREAESTP